MQQLGGYLAVILGAGLGGGLRHAVNRAFVIPLSFPWNTLIVNVVGSFAIGVVAGWLAPGGESRNGVRLFLATGLIGGFTTFSAFSLEVVLMWERGEMRSAVTYAASSLILGVLGVFLGLALVRSS